MNATEFANTNNFEQYVFENRWRVQIMSNIGDIHPSWPWSIALNSNEFLDALLSMKNDEFFLAKNKPYWVFVHCGPDTPH